MKIVYGRINNDLYEMEIYNHAIVAKKARGLSQDEKWESPGDYTYGQLPTSAILHALRCSRILFSEEDFENVRGSLQIIHGPGEIGNSARKIEIITNEIINRYWDRIHPKRDPNFNFEKLGELLDRPCRILFNFRSIVVQNDNAIALYDVFG